MGYLQHIKSPEMYVRMMQTLMFPMPPAEREEACQEVRQHLEALVDDFRAEGHSPEEAVRLAIQQFGNPFRVGSQIWKKWDQKKSRQAEVTKPTLARRRKWLRYLSVSFTAGGTMLILSNTTAWLPLVFLSAGQGLLAGCLLVYQEALDERINGPRGLSWSASRQWLQESEPQIVENLLQNRSLWNKLSLFVSKRMTAYLLNLENHQATKSATFSWNVRSVVFFVTMLAALISWSSIDHEGAYFKRVMIFLLVSIQAQGVSRVLMNRLFLRGRTA